MASNQFLFKPQSEKGTLAILMPTQFNDRIDQIELIDNSSGQVIEAGRFTNRFEDGRGIFRFSRAGNQFGSDIGVRIRFDDGN